MARGKATRAVVFAERIATLGWLQESLCRDLGFSTEEVRILHGGLSDQEQQGLVESFKQESSPIRVLVTGDVASEGVNLHLQCHHLVHFDIPWSLIRIEQRNGRIDRYGQKHPPQITTLLLTPAHEKFSGDLRVLTRLLEKEQEAHAGPRGCRVAHGQVRRQGRGGRGARRAARREGLRRRREHARAGALDGRLLARSTLLAADPGSRPGRGRRWRHPQPPPSLYDTDVDFLEEACTGVCRARSHAPAAGGVRWRRHDQEQIVELVPPSDLRARLDVLPQTYLAERRVAESLVLATSKARGKDLLAQALADGGGSVLAGGPLPRPAAPGARLGERPGARHLSRNQVFARTRRRHQPDRAAAGHPHQPARPDGVVASWLSVAFLNPRQPRAPVVEPCTTPPRTMFARARRRAAR